MASNLSHKAAVDLLKAVGHITFDPAAFARVISEDDERNHHLVMLAFLAVVEEFAFLYHNTSRMTVENSEAFITAARISEALEVYNGNAD